MRKEKIKVERKEEKMKLKTKILIITLLSLFVVLIGASNVKAAEVTEEHLQEMLNVLPDNVNINLKESEYEKASEEVEKQVKAIWQEKGIDTTGVEISNVWASLTYGSKEDFYKAEISIRKIGEGSYDKQKSKNFNITYKNHNNYNQTDEQSIKNLKIESPRYFEVNLDFIKNGNISQMQLIENYYNKLINDSSITIKATAGAGGSDGSLNGWTWESGTNLVIFKNDILYDIRNMDQECTVPVITIPNNVTDNEVDNYITSEIEKIYNKVKISKITKGLTLTDSRLQHKWSKEVPNGYTIEHTDTDGLRNNSRKLHHSS